MATKTRIPTSEVAVTGTWSGASRHLLLDDHPDSANPAADVTTCSAAGALVMGFTAFDVPANSTNISVQVLYYDFKNGSQGSVAGSCIRCNDTTNRNSSATHNPGNGNANIALRTDDYTTNPKSGAAWTVADVNGTGTNGLTSFGVRVTDASPTVAFSSALLQVTYTPPSTPFSADLSAAGFSLGGQSVTRVNKFSGVLAARSFAFSGQSLSMTWAETLAYVAELTAASLSMNAEAMTRFTDWVGTLSAASLSFTAQSLSRVNDWKATLTARIFAFTARAITLTAEAVGISLPNGSVVYGKRAYYQGRMVCTNKPIVAEETVNAVEAIHYLGVKYIEDVADEAVPSTAVVNGAKAYSHLGVAYVTTQAHASSDVYIGGVAVRQDGAVRVTDEESEPTDTVVNGCKMKQDGTARVSLV